MTALFDLLVRLLPAKLRPFAKSVLPALAASVAVAAQFLSTGAFDRAALATAVTGLSAALVAYLTSNDGHLLDEAADVPDAGVVSGGVLFELPSLNDASVAPVGAHV
jgi:hypothetical protein